jgi:hypothetical protein
VHQLNSVLEDINNKLSRIEAVTGASSSSSEDAVASDGAIAKARVVGRHTAFPMIEPYNTGEPMSNPYTVSRYILL